ncbi:hypothetical protein [Nocardia thraciensis]
METPQSPDRTADEVRVDRTGLALVHEGELIKPAPGSAAGLSAAGPHGRTINYHFPVHIEVVGELAGEQLDRVAAHLFTELDNALRSVG